MNADKITTAAVVAYARQLRARAEKEADPYYKPYAPSDEAARKMVQRHHGDASEALKTMKARAALDRREHDEKETEAKRSEDRHRRRQQQDERDKQAKLAGVTKGQRIDTVRAQATVLAAASAASTDSGRISSSSSGGTGLPRHGGDTSAAVEFAVDECIRTIERLVDRDRRRQFGDDPTDDRVARLLKMARRGLSPHDMAIVDPMQGPPRMIRQQLVQLGIDPDTGRPIDRGEVAA